MRMRYLVRCMRAACPAAERGDVPDLCTRLRIMRIVLLFEPKRKRRGRTVSIRNSLRSAPLFSSRHTRQHLCVAVGSLSTLLESGVWSVHCRLWRENLQCAERYLLLRTVRSVSASKARRRVTGRRSIERTYFKRDGCDAHIYNIKTIIYLFSYTYSLSFSRAGTGFRRDPCL